MKIVFINPGSKNPGEIQQKCFEPVNLLYLASSLLGHGYRVDILDANALALSGEAVSEKVKAMRPDLIGIPLLSEIFFPTYSLIRGIRDGYPDGKIVLGGPHVNALAQRVLEEFREVDYALTGESEESIVRLCQALEKRHEISQVKGLFYRKDGIILGNQPAEPIKDLDNLRPPARFLLEDLYKSNKYYMILTKQRPVGTIITSRGCPARCRFCSIISKEYRARSAESVLDEITELYAKGIRNIDIADANFTFDRERAMRIFDLIKKKKLGIAFRFKSRSDALDEELVKSAKEAGAYLISLGLESGSQKILQRMAKGTTIEANVSACEIVMKAGLKLNTGWIIGFPGETPETIRQTVDLILRIKPTTASIKALIPYPGTGVYEEAKAEATLMGDWSLKCEFMPWVKLPWTKSYADLKKATQWAKNKIYYRPYYMRIFIKEILGNSNLLLARYALQESIKSLKFINRPKGGQDRWAHYSF